MRLLPGLGSSNRGSAGVHLRRNAAAGECGKPAAVVSILRQNPLFGFGLAVCAVLAAGELALLGERFTASRRADRALAGRHRELQSMSELTPPPSPAVAAAITSDLGETHVALAAIHDALRGRGADSKGRRGAAVPVARTDVYFDLVSFVQRSREQARRAGIELRPDAAGFGFSAYANEGPPAEHLEPVSRQRRVAQALVEALLEARPRALLAIKRERPLGKSEHAARATARRNGETLPERTGAEGADYFTLDPRISVRRPGFLDAMAFRFVFTGRTVTLRTFLNRLAGFETPVLVREVEVDHATTEESALAVMPEEHPSPGPARLPPAASIFLTSAPATTGARAPAAAAKPAAARAVREPMAVPMVAKTYSKFTVTVEVIELLVPAVPAAAAGAVSSAP